MLFYLIDHDYELLHWASSFVVELEYLFPKVLLEKKV